MADAAHVIGAGLLARDLLQPPAEGVVYAVFESTFYLKRSMPDNRSGIAPALCCIGLANLQPGPINIRTSLQQMPEIAVGDRWYCHANKLTIGTIELDIAQTTLWLPPQTPTSLKPVYASVELAYRFIASNAPSGHNTANTDQQTIDVMVEQRLSKASSELQQWLNEDEGIPFPLALLGCGTGLTPAGDDILVGALVAMHTWQHSKLDQMIAHVSSDISKTSEISAAHLLAACAGSGIEPLHHLITVISQASPDREVIAATQKLCNYGHSSGYYALQGVMLASTCYRN